MGNSFRYYPKKGIEKGIKKMGFRNVNRYPSCIDHEGETDSDRLEALEELLCLTREMRRAQKDYFSQRTDAALTRSKNLERIIDKKIGELTYPQQGSFF